VPSQEFLGKESGEGPEQIFEEEPSLTVEEYKIWRKTKDALEENSGKLEDRLGEKLNDPDERTVEYVMETELDIPDEGRMTLSELVRRTLAGMDRSEFGYCSRDYEDTRSNDMAWKVYRESAEEVEEWLNENEYNPGVMDNLRSSFSRLLDYYVERDKDRI